MAAPRRAIARLARTRPTAPVAWSSRARLSTPLALRVSSPATLRLSRTLVHDSANSALANKDDLAPTVDKSRSKLYKDADEAVADIESGSTVFCAGFGLCGTPDTLITAIAKRGEKDLNHLKAVSNNAGAGADGLAVLVNSGQVKSLILSFLGANKTLEKKWLTGEISIELTPQGTIAERLRAAGAGIPAFYTPTGVSTFIETGEIPIKYKPAAEGQKPEVEIPGKKRETRVFDGRTFNLEHALHAEVALIRANKVDEAGNAVFRYTTGNFGPMMAKAAKCTIVEAEEIVPIGSLNPDEIDLPGIYVDRIVPATEQKKLEIKKLRAKPGEETKVSSSQKRRERIARRAAKELQHGMYVNLGVGMPTLAPSYLDPSIKVWIHSENGLLGMGPYPTEEELDVDIINAGKETVTIVPGGSTFDSSESFGMIRGGHIDVSMLGALQVSANGDLANYFIPGQVLKGMGGAMDLVSNPDKTKIVVLTDHTAKDGSPKIVQECDLPLTGARCASTIITDLAVFQVDRKNGGLTLTETAPDVSVEEIQKKTGAKFAVADNLGTME